MFGKGRGSSASSKDSKGHADELKIALDNRAFEIQLFWQRSNYFLVLMTALGIGTFTIKDPLLSPAVATLATICSYLWFKTNLGSKFWQENWEEEVTILARELGVRSFEKSMSEVIEQVKGAVVKGNEHERISLFHRWIDEQVVKKPSVTYHMIQLSFWSTVIWSVVAGVFYVRLAKAVCSTYVCIGCVGET